MASHRVPLAGLCVVLSLLLSLLPAPTQALAPVPGFRFVPSPVLAAPHWVPPDEASNKHQTMAAYHYYVDAVSGSDSSGNGSEAAPWRTITYALAQVVEVDVEVHVAAGLYDTALGETFPISMRPGVSLTGTEYPQTVLQAAGSGNVVDFPNTQAFTPATVLSGFKIMGGSNGVVIHGRTGTAGTAPTVQGNWITGNGNGILNNAETNQRIYAVIRDNLISANTNQAVLNYGCAHGTYVNPVIENNQVLNNSRTGIYMRACGAGSSGDADNSFSSPTIRHNLIAGNLEGGLLCSTNYAGACNAQVKDTIIRDNSGWGWARSHSGTYLVTNRPQFVNNVVYDNASGGLQFIMVNAEDRDLPTLINDTIADNHAYGVRNGVPTIVNTIIWGHTDNLNTTATLVSYSDVGDADYEGINHNLSVDPQFADSGQGDYHLLPTSPLLDAGDSGYSSLPPLDMDGDPRILGAAAGIGADETAPYTVEIEKSVSPAAPVLPGDMLTYTLAISNTSSRSAGGVLVTDQLPAGTQWDGRLQASGGSAGVDGGLLTWQGTLLMGQRQTITCGVTVAPELSWPTAITNTATVDNRSGSITDSLPAVINLTPLPFWGASRQQVDDPYPVPAQRLVYTLLVSNTGTLAATATVTDSLDPNVNLAWASDGGLPGAGQVVWSGLAVAPGSQVSLTLAVTVAAPLADGVIIDNDVLVAGGPVLPVDLPIARAVVYNPPVAAFDAAPRTGASPLAVTFTDASQRADSYLWSYGDGSSGTSAGTYSHTYDTPGIYTVTLTVANRATVDTLTRSHYITVEQGPIAGFQAAPLIGVAPQAVVFTNTSAYVNRFVWDYGDGLTSTVTATVHSHVYTQPGVYDVALAAGNDYGWSEQNRTAYLTVYAPVQAAFSATPLEGIEPLSVQFSNESSGVDNYLWDFGDGTTSQAQAPLHVYSQDGLYTVTLTAWNAADSDTLVRPEYVTVHPVPVVDFDAQPQVGLAPLDVILTNNTQDADEYLWSYGDGLTSTIGTLHHLHTYSQAGTYDVSLAASNAYAQASLLRQGFVRVFDPVTAAFEAEPRLGVTPLSVSFDNRSTGATNYLWSFGEGQTSTAFEPVHTYTTPGRYTVTLQASNPADSDTLSYANYITVCNSPIADFTGAPTFGTTPLLVSFGNNSHDGETYHWDYGDGASSDTASPLHSHAYLEPGVYTVTLAVANACAADTLVRQGYVVAYNPPLPADFYVDANYGSNISGDGSEAAPWKTITYALARLSGPGIRVHVASGTYSAALGESLPILMKPGVSLLGEGSDTTVLSGTAGNYVVRFSGGGAYQSDTELSGFRITGGLVGVCVEGAASPGSAPLIQNNWLTGNTYGALNYSEPARLLYAVYQNNRISNNSSHGMYNYADAVNNGNGAYSSPRVYYNEIVDNGGAGIYNYAYGWSGLDRGHAHPWITGNLIAGNAGSGIRSHSDYAGMCEPVIQNNVIRDNQGWGVKHDEGPLEYWTSNTPRLIGNIIYGNRSGGAILFVSDTGLVLNNTIVGNGPYGVFKTVEDYGYRIGTVTVVNSIIWGHTYDLSNVPISTISYSDISDPGYAGSNHNLSVDPGFVDPGDGDYHLLPGSPVVDKGNDDQSWLPDTDIDLEPRIVGAAVDMGADEVPLYVEVKKEVTPNPVYNGAVLTYTLFVTNGSTVDLHAIVLDLLPAHVAPGGTQTWLPTIAAGGGVWSQALTVTVEAGYVGVLVNQVVVTSQEGASGGAAAAALVVDMPVAGLEASNSSPTVLGQATTLTATITAGTNVTFAWALGDGQNGSGAQLDHLYSTPGVYTAVVTASNGSSLVTATAPVMVQEAIGGLAAQNDSPTALGSATILSATVTAGSDLTYTWSFGDGGSGSAATVSHVYRGVGTYTATVTAANDVSLATASTVVQVEESIAGLVAHNNSPTALGSATILTATVDAGSGVQYTWAFGDGQAGSGPSPTHIYPVAGLYTTVVTAANDVSLATATTKVRVEEVAAGLVATNDSPTTLGSATILTATLAGGSSLTYTWSLGDGQTGSGPTVSHVYQAVGLYTATVTVTNSVDLQTAWTVVEVAEPLAGLKLVHDDPTPLGSATTLTASLTAGDPVFYSWDWGDGTGLAAEYGSGSGLGLAIPDNGCAGGQYLEHTLDVTAWGRILDLDVAILDLRHGWDADLSLCIVSPQGTEVALSTGNGGNGENYYQTVFDDEAEVSIEDGMPPFSGHFRPKGSLSALYGQQQQGTWRLRVCDASPGTSGTLNEWGLQIVATTPGPATVQHAYPAVGIYSATVTAYNAVSEMSATTAVTITDIYRRVYQPLVVKK